MKTQKRAREMAHQAKVLATKPDPLSTSPIEVHSCFLKGSVPLSLSSTMEALSSHCYTSAEVVSSPLQTSLVSSPEACTGWGVGLSSHPSTQHSSSITHLTWKSPVSHLQP